MQGGPEHLSPDEIDRRHANMVIRKRIRESMLQEGMLTRQEAMGRTLGMETHPLSSLLLDRSSDGGGARQCFGYGDDCDETSGMHASLISARAPPSSFKLRMPSENGMAGLQTGDFFGKWFQNMVDRFNNLTDYAANSTEWAFGSKRDFKKEKDDAAFEFAKQIASNTPTQNRGDIMRSVKITCCTPFSITRRPDVLPSGKVALFCVIKSTMPACLTALHGAGYGTLCRTGAYRWSSVDRSICNPVQIHFPFIPSNS